MHVIEARNVCEALPAGVEYLRAYGRIEKTRAGDCLVAPGPVVTVTRKPEERVLFSWKRDANPFFHMMEAIWMLNGEEDATFLDKYVKDFSERFGEAGGQMHGAYGHRWRRAIGFDQLDFVVKKLRDDPGTRQCVIQMWDAYDLTVTHGPTGDGVKIGSNDLRGSWKDRPCNTHVYLRVRQEEDPLRPKGLLHPFLDLTVCCRSNDMLMGAHGANAVHFSVLQEYLASRIGVDVGVMYQFSNNYHVYLADLERLEVRDGSWSRCLYGYDDTLSTQKMFSRHDKIDQDVQAFCRWNREFVDQVYPVIPEFRNPWFRYTAAPAAVSYALFRMRRIPPAIQFAESIQAPDWRFVCVEWLQRRMKQ